MKTIMIESYAGKMIICLMILLLTTCLSYAQKEIVIKIYHGMNKQTQFLQKIDNSQPIDMAGSTYTDVYLPKGTKIILEIVNAHIANYKYGFTSTSTPFSPTSTDISEFSERINTSLKERGGSGNADNKSIDVVSGRIEGYLTNIENVKKYIAKSDQPKQYLEIKNGITSSYLEAVKKIKEELNQKFTLEEDNFNNLNGTIKTIFKKYLDHLNLVRDEYLELYNAPKAVYRDTVVIGEGITEISLAIKARNKDTVKIRDTGKELIKIQIKQKYERPTLSLIPLAYAIYIKDYDEFEIKDGVLAKRNSIAKFDFRVGTMLAISPFELSESNEYGLSFGLGTNLIGGDLAALKEFFLGSFLSYKDIFHIGIGWGMARSPSLKSGAQIGNPLPEGKNLDDLLEYNRDNSSFFILFSLKGLDLY